MITMPDQITAQLPDTPMQRRMAAGHLIRTGHKLAGVLIYDGGGIWHMERTCCAQGSE